MYREYWNRWNTKHLTFFEGEGAGAGGGTGAGTEVKKEEPKKEEPKKDDDEPSEEELAEISQARDLMRVLKDPNSRKELITKLALAEGITKDSTPKEVRAAQKSIESIIAAHMGDEFKEFGGRLSKAFKEVLDLFEEERIKPDRQKIADRELNEARSAASTGYDKAFSEFSNSNELEKDVAALVKEFPPSEGADPYKYFKRILKIAADEKGVTLKAIGDKKTAVDDFNKSRNDKLTRNRNDAGSRTVSDSGDGKDVKTSPTKRMSLDEAIAAGATVADKLLTK